MLRSQGRELVAFSTPTFNAAVAEFKNDGSGRIRQMYAYGQFYVTGRTIDDMLGWIESELRSNIRFILSPAQRDATLKWFREKLRVDVREISVVAVNAMLDVIEHNGDLAAIRVMFRSSAAGKQDMADARADFEQIWSDDAIPATPSYRSGSPLAREGARRAGAREGPLLPGKRRAGPQGREGPRGWGRRRQRRRSATGSRALRWRRRCPRCRRPMTWGSRWCCMPTRGR